MLIMAMALRVAMAVGGGHGGDGHAGDGHDEGGDGRDGHDEGGDGRDGHDNDGGDGHDIEGGDGHDKSSGSLEPMAPVPAASSDDSDGDASSSSRPAPAERDDAEVRRRGREALEAMQEQRQRDEEALNARSTASSSSWHGRDRPPRGRAAGCKGHGSAGFGERVPAFDPGLAEPPCRKPAAAEATGGVPGVPRALRPPAPLGCLGCTGIVFSGPSAMEDGGSAAHRAGPGKSPTSRCPGDTEAEPWNSWRLASRRTQAEAGALQGLQRLQAAPGRGHRAASL